MWTSEEQKEHRALWIADLRSRQYSQTRGTLRDNHGMCCLGVACDTYRKNVEGAPEWTNDAWGAAYSGSTSVPPREVSEWLGLRTAAGDFENEGHHHPNNYLTGLNDHARYTFEQIADLVESEPEGLLGEFDPSA